MPMQLVDSLNKALTFCIFLLCALVSFLPEYAHGKYWNWTTIFLAAFLSILILHREIRKYLFHPCDWPLWLLLIGLLSGTVVATDRAAAWRTSVHLTAAFFLLYYIGKGLFSSPRHRVQTIYFICFSASVVIFIAILELYFRRNVLYENFIPNPFYERYVYLSRPMSTQANPVILGSYLIATLPFSSYLWKQKSFFRLWGICLTVLSLGMIFLTFSRGVFLGLLGLSIAYLLMAGRKRLILVLIGLVALFSFLCGHSDVPNIMRFGPNELVVGSYNSIISPYRFERVAMTKKILEQSPLFGIGFQHFRIRFKEFCPPQSVNTSYEFKIPDNMYLTFLAETGIAGTLVFLIFIFAILRRTLARLKKAENTEDRLLLVILTCALAGLLVNMGAYEMFYWQNPLMLFALICGFTAGMETGTA
jgi:O-antigen ligase